jgi:protein-S-isoprenylcysteine O-methyltransferase Ste14
MFVFMRTVTYASLFIGLVLTYLPSRVLAWAGISRPADFGWAQIAGIALCSIGATIALWCVGAFARIGKGTPAPFDPPRRLVVRGPYRFVRNPMYIGASATLAGAALFFTSWSLFAFVCGFVLVTHLFVILYEEPTLKRLFGPEYSDYCAHVARWHPHLGPAN